MSPISAIRCHASTSVYAEHPFSEADTYLVSDAAPYVDLRLADCEPFHLTAQSRIDWEPTQDNPQSDWRRYCLTKSWFERRRPGLTPLTFGHPAANVNAYVVPERLLSVADALAMLTEIDERFGYRELWDRRPDAGQSRAWTTREGTHTDHALDELLDAVDDELRVALLLDRYPLDSDTTEDPPEFAIVPRWAARRNLQLRNHGSRLEHEIHDLETRCATSSGKQQQAMIRRLARGRAQMNRLVTTLTRVAGRAGPIDRPLILSPLMQRHPYLRTLLKSLAPPTRIALSVNVGPTGTYPVVPFNDIFERWCAARLITIALDRGFEIVATKTSRTGGQASWILVRGDINLVVDFEPHPLTLPTDDTPVRHRRQALSKWLASRTHHTDLCATKVMSPDLVLRVTQGARRALGVADATLADPRYTSSKDSKPATVARYVEHLLWRHSTGVVRCASTGGLVLFPTLSGDIQHQTHFGDAPDVWIVCTSVSAPNDGGLAEYLEHLIDLVA